MVMYKVSFINNDVLTIDSDENIDLHQIKIAPGGGGSISFNDLWINLENVTSIQKIIKKEKSKNISKSCSTCKYETNLIPAEPCFSCIHGLCDENINRTEKWEAKEK
ncbi:MAG: hypothetical protein IIT65_11550 [Lachnospiraceae bacterium]|nr:hypothetical protein [Lachnospiraceae bacterium]